MIVVGIDFDGTVVTHDYPEIGQHIGAVPWLEKILETGAKIVLNTMRSGYKLQEAVDWFYHNEIELYGINENPTRPYVDWEVAGPMLIEWIKEKQNG